MPTLQERKEAEERERREKENPSVFTVISEIDPSLVSSYGWAGNPLGPWIVGHYSTEADAKKAAARARKIVHDDPDVRSNEIENRVWIEPGRLNEGDIDLEGEGMDEDEE